MRSIWICAALPLCMLLTNAGCGSGDVQLSAKVETPKPPPPPPPADADGDGVLDDGTDKCVGEKEDNLPPDPKDGCKSADADGDGIVGEADKCPTEPETKNEFQDDDGCPDTLPKVRLTATEVKITDKILFAVGKATIEKASDELLDSIAKVVKENPQVEFLEVAGHADKDGPDASNVVLTNNRAKAVLEALAKRGVDKKRMRAAGYGPYCPVDPGDSAEAKEKNRRVEFKVMKLDGKETGVPLGCEGATAKGIKPAGVPATAPTKEQNKAAAGGDKPAGAADKAAAAGGDKKGEKKDEKPAATASTKEGADKPKDAPEPDGKK